MAYAGGDSPSAITHTLTLAHRRGHYRTHTRTHLHPVEWKESCTRRAFDDALKYLHKKLRLLLVVGYGKWCRSFTTPCTSQLPLTTTGKKKKMLLQQ